MWFLPEWTNPGIHTSLGFTAGLIGLAACAPLVGHAALAYPTGRLRSRLERAVVPLAYANAVLLLGLLPTTVFDPKDTGCLQCPRNLVLTSGDAGLHDTFNRYGIRFGIAWLLALAVLLGWRLARSSRAIALVTSPVAVPAIAYVALVAWDLQHSLGAGFLSNDGFDVRTWRLEALALVLLSGGVCLGLGRERRARSSVARLVVELGRAPRPGAVRDALAAALGDPTLELAYRRPGAEQYVDAAGLPVAVVAGEGRVVTPLLGGDRTVAALVHDARLREHPGLVEEAVSAARLAVENEQLQAEVRAQLEDLRASRARIVEAADLERRRLERDLHDGAQQRIVALSLGLRLLRSQLGADPDPEQEQRIEAAEEKVRQGLAELRELAHGIYPAVLSDEGLAAALEALAEQADARIRLRELADGRFAPAVENAAYFTVVESLRGATTASVGVESRNGHLLVRIQRDADGNDPAGLTEIADRVGALDGRLTANGTEILAEIPCGS